MRNAVCRSSRCFAAAVLGVAGLLVANRAAAQGPGGALHIELLDRGKPIPNAQVSVVETGDLLNQGKPMGATSANGMALLDLGKVAFQPGTRVEVWIRTCQGRNEVVLVPEGATTRCNDDRTPEAARCGCERLGAFVWGPGRLLVDVGTRTVTHRPTVTGGGSRHTVSLGGGIGFYPNLKDALESQDGLTGMTGGTSGRNMFLSYEYQPAGLPITFGAGLGCTHFGEFEQTFSGTGGAPTRNLLDFDIITVGTQVGVRRDFSDRLGVFGGLDFLMALNKVDLQTFYSGSTDPVIGRRSESGLRIGATLGADVTLAGRAGLRAMAGYGRGKGKDADTHWSFGLGFRYNLSEGRVP